MAIKQVSKLWQELLTQLHGFFVVVIFLVFVLLFLPIYIYRCGLSLIAKIFFKGKIGNPVTAFANAFTVDFYPESRLHPKSAVVTTSVLDGKLGIKEVESIVTTQWLEESSGLVEFKQYVEPWMGFMFWKVDTGFELKNHLTVHTFDRNGNGKEVCLFVEELLNKPFVPKRSPWECHVIENYQDKHLSSKSSEGEMTLIIFRFHHCLADGYAILYSLVEKLGGTPISKMVSSPSKKASRNLMMNLSNSVTFPFRLFTAISNYAGLFNTLNKRISFGVTDDVKVGRILYDRCATAVAIEMIKEIKNKFGVNFNTVLLAGLAAGLTGSVQNFRKKSGKKNLEEKDSILFLVPLPLPGHPKKLINHVTGTYIKLPVSPELNPIQRLKIIEGELEKSKNSLVPVILPWLIKSVGSLFVNMSASLLKNRVMQAGFSNFVGPTIPAKLFGKIALATDFVSGTHVGVSAAGFFLLSFGNEIHITAAVESEVFDRTELKSMMGCVLREFEILHELTKSIK